MTTRTLEIDCPPGNTRPMELFETLCKQTGLDPANFNLISKVFGCWTWEIKDLEKYQAVQNSIQQLMSDWYKDGTIRYGSW